MIGFMKVMIIDDEPNIREGLKTLIDWEKLHCTLVGEAQNGVEGIDKILLLKPDLVIVDIKMPEIDGIQLIETITRKEIPAKFIVLTGYRDFDYAKRAMECQVNHYILKPIDEEVLAQKVSEIRDCWYNDKKNQIVLNQQCQLSKEQIIKYLIMGYERLDTFVYSESNYEELNQWFHLELPWKSYTVLLIDTIDKGLNFTERAMLKQHLKKLSDYKVFFETEGLIGILAKNKNFEKHDGSLECIRKWIAMELHKEAIITVGLNVNELSEVNGSYAYAKYLMDHRFLYGNQTILHKKLIHRQQNKVLSTQYEEDTELKLYQAVCTNQQNQVNNLLEGMRCYMETSGWDSEKIKAFYLHVYVSVMTSLVEHQHGLLEREFLNPKVFEAFYQQSNLFKLHGFIKYQLLTICGYIEEMKPQNTLGKVIDYIKHHYQEDLKIEGLGKLFHYSSNYLGKQFKKETGQSFNSFVDELRLKEAQSLLKNSELKIYEISQIIGFRDPDYFTAKFRKLTGLSPTDYRARLKDLPL
jgi:two-component system response regulator YesN